MIECEILWRTAKLYECEYDYWMASIFQFWVQRHIFYCCSTGKLVWFLNFKLFCWQNYSNWWVNNFFYVVCTTVNFCDCDEMSISDISDSPGRCIGQLNFWTNKKIKHVTNESFFKIKNKMWKTACRKFSSGYATYFVEDNNILRCVLWWQQTWMADNGERLVIKLPISAYTYRQDFKISLKNVNSPQKWQLTLIKLIGI
jgi:hypothetical protein